jgi:hypothetical protein
MSANTWMRRAKANKFGIFFMFMLVLILSIPAKIVEAQATKPEIPRPQFIEPFPLSRDTTFFGETTTIGSPLASSITTRVLDAGDSLIHGLIFYDNYLWASTRTIPGRILKINPTTLAVESRIILLTGLDYAEDIKAGNGFIWSITSTDPAYLIRVNPATMTYTSTALSTGGSNYLAFGESLDYSFGKLWAGGYNKLAEIDITTTPPTFVLHDYSALVQSDFLLGTSLSNDSNYLWAVFGQRTFAPPYIAGSTILRINPSNPGSGYISENLTTTFPDDMFNSGGYLFTSSEETGVPSYVYRFPVSISPYNNSLASSTSISYGTFFDLSSPQVFWGSFTGSPGVIKKFTPSLIELWTFQLPTNFDDPSEIVFDAVGNMYVSTFQDPSGMVKFTPPDAVTITASKSGNNMVIGWLHADIYVDHYEVWRSSNPYFTPGEVGSVKLADVIPSAGTGTYTDIGAIGDVNNNYYYVVKAVNSFGLVSPVSNRVGEYDYQLFTLTSLNKNDIALALDIPGVTDAVSLASYFGNFVRRVARYKPDTQSFQTYIVGLPATNFPITTGEFAYLYTDNTAPSVVTLVGRVPVQGSITFQLFSGNPAKKNFISLPLELNNLTTASQVALDIGSGVSRIFRWRGSTQSTQTYIPGLPATDFPIVIGEPFGLQLLPGAPSTWP